MWQSVKTSFLTVTFALLAFFIITKIFGPIPFTVNSINTNKESLFSVTATAEVNTIPSTTQISFGVNKKSPTVEAAKQEVNIIINRITTDLKGLGIPEKDIKTSNYSVSPNYDYTSGGEKLNGYNVSANIDVTIKKVEIANKAIDVATKNGATQVGGLQFVLNEDEKNKFEDDARKIAIGKAKQKAASIAKTAGIKLGRVVDVQESGNEIPRPYYGLEAADTMQKQLEPTQLNPGENKVTSTVTLYYETY